jgi:hypothetical protein
MTEARILLVLFTYVQQSNGSIVRWCGRNVGLQYAHHDAMLLLFHDPTIQIHLVELGQYVILHAVPVNFKEFQAEFRYKLLTSPLLLVPLQ